MNDMLKNLWNSLSPVHQENKNIANIFNDFKSKTKKTNDLIKFNPVGQN
jgi:hypothetical protein